MALNPAKLQKTMEATLLSALSSEFAKEASSDPSTYKRMAKAISQIAKDIVTAITTEAQVAPGIKVDTSGGPGATTAPGKIT